MDLDEYQRRARETDQNPKPNGSGEFSSTVAKTDVIPLLGLVGEVGALLAEYKKLLRDGATYRRFPDQVAEELGDIMWYVANVADKFNLKLTLIAEENLKKLADRWRGPTGAWRLYDEGLPNRQQLPRQFEYSFEYRTIKGAMRVIMVDVSSGKTMETTGDPLSDNAYDDDGYRFHDVIHLSFAACLGWSPVLRKLLRDEKVLDHRTPANLDEIEDGGRARVVEEAIAFASYVYAADHDFLAHADTVDWQLLRHIKLMTSRLEVRNRTTNEWNRVLLQAFAIWRELRRCDGGRIRGDLTKRSIEFIPQIS